MIKKLLILAVLLFVSNYAFAQSSPEEQELLSTAQQAFNDGFQDVALRYLEDFVSKYPDSPKLESAKLLLGQCYFLRNQFPKALAIFESLNNQSADKDAIFFWLGETYLKQQQYPQAQLNYEAVLKNFPQSPYVPQAYYSLGWLYFELKKYDEAKSVFKKLVAKFPMHQFSDDALSKIAECEFNGGHFQQAINDFEAYLAKFPQSNQLCAMDLNIAESHYYLEHFEAALPYYQKVIANSTCDDNSKLTAYVGDIWSEIKLKKYTEAENISKNVEEFVKIKKLPGDDIALALANLRYEQGNYSQAADAFTQFIKNFPQSTHVLEAYLGRANTNYLLKKYDEAASDYHHILDSGNQDSWEKAEFGLGWTELKRGHLQEAIDSFQNVFNKSQDPAIKANALTQIADANQDSGHLDEAGRAYDRVLANYPHNAMADYVQYRQAIALLKSEKIEMSQAAFHSLQVNFPQSKYLEDIDYYMGVISFKKGDWQNTVTLTERFLKSLTRPSEFTPEANYILALSYLNLKQPEDALRIFQKILRLYPDDINVAKNADIGIAKCEFELGQIKEAVKRFKLIVYKYPKTDAAFEALLWLAQDYLKNADYSSAIASYQALIDQFPDSNQMDQIHYELAQAYELQGQSDQALEEYKNISSKDPNLIAKAKLAMAGILSKDMDPQRAIAAYESIIVTNPDFAGVSYLKLGQLYRNSQNYEKEIEVYQKALKVKNKGGINPAQLQFNLGDTLELMSHTEDAIEQYLKIPHLYPDQQVWVVKAYLRVAKIYEEGNDWEGARVTYQKIIQLNTEEAKFAQERLDWIKNNATNRNLR